MEFVCVGKIVKAQGIKGEVKILPLIDNPDIFRGEHPLYIEKQEVKTISRAYRQDAAFVHFAGVNDRNLAEGLRGKKVFISLEDFDRISQDDFLIDDLVGCVIFDENGEQAGQILGVTNYGFDDVLIVKSEGRMFEIPFKKDIFGVEKNGRNLKITCIKKEFNGAKVEREGV